jgi:tetratricopeptide (TPR) repeat protein
MRQNRFTIIFLCAVMGAAIFGCTREMGRNGDQREVPFDVSHIPALTAGQGEEAVEMSANAGQESRSTVTPELVTGDEASSENADVVSLIDQGRQLIIQNKYEEAIPKFMSAIAIEPNNTRALYNLGFCYRQLGQLDKAIDFSRRAVQSDPNQPYVHQNLGYALEANGQVDEAIAEYEEELRLRPADANLSGIASKLALLYMGKDLMDEAFDAANRAVTLAPDNPANHVVLAQVDMKNRAYDQAISEFTKATDLAPNSGLYHKLLGDAYWEAGKETEARTEYAKAIELDASQRDQIEPARLP